MVTIRLYQVFEAERFLGTRRAIDGETKEGTKQRLVTDYGYSATIAIFFTNYVK